VRGEADGGAKEGTPELYLGDPDGIVVQLQDPSYCGGAGVLGNVCRHRSSLRLGRDCSRYGASVISRSAFQANGAPWLFIGSFSACRSRLTKERRLCWRSGLGLNSSPWAAGAEAEGVRAALPLRHPASVTHA
jgi:hypothetical protein